MSRVNRITTTSVVGRCDKSSHFIPQNSIAQSDTVFSFAVEPAALLPYCTSSQ
jgi:hypothetical protein